MTLDPTSEPSPDLPTDPVLPSDDQPSAPTMPAFAETADDAAAPTGQPNPMPEPPAFAQSPHDDAAYSGLPLSPAEAARDNARRGAWAMSEFYDGWVLLGADGRPVTRNDGSRVGFRFADVARLSETLAAAPEDETADETGRRALAPLDARFNKDWDPQRPKSTLADMTKWTRLLAYHLVQTTEPEEAVRRAISMIFGNPVTLNGSGTKLWVPTQYDAEAVKSIADTLLRQAVGPEPDEGDGEDPEAAPANDPLPATRTIRGVPLDGRGFGANVVKAAATSSKTQDREPPLQERDGKIRNRPPRPPQQQPRDISAVLGRYRPSPFDDELAKKESGGNPYNGYGTYVFAEGAYAYGRYQMRWGALTDIKMLDDQGNWTGRFGVRSWRDFLQNPQAQEAAFIELKDLLEASVQKHHQQRLGKTITGITTDITVTQSGLIAAMHKRGRTGVLRYFQWLENNAWNSRDNIKNIPPGNRRNSFLEIETRLREFQHVQY